MLDINKLLDVFFKGSSLVRLVEAIYKSGKERVLTDLVGGFNPIEKY